LWRRRGGVSFPLFGKSRQTFGIVRAGPLRWHFSKNLSAGRSRRSYGDCGLPMRQGLYRCPRCKTYRARKINWIGKPKLACAKCGCVCKLRKVKKIKKGLIFRRTVGYGFGFEVLRSNA
jgi:hypothetical protein